MKLKRCLALALIVGLLTGCGGGGSSLPGPRPVENPNPTPTSNPSGTSAVFVIRIPSSPSTQALAHVRPLGYRSPTPSITPDYISPSTQSISISVNGAKPVVANLTPTSPNCTPATSSNPLTCTITAPAPPGTDTFVVTTFDKTGATGNKLATASVTPPPIVIGQANSVFITMNGIVASILLVLQGQASEGTPTTIGLSVMAEDADGNIIISPGVYNNGPISLTDSDSSGNTSFSSNGVTLPNPTTINQPTNTLSLTYDGLGNPSATISASESGVSKITNATLSIAQKFKEYSLPAGTQPWGLAAGPDGNIWFVGASSATVGSVNPISGVVTAEASLSSGSKPQGIVAGPDGNLWVTENQGNFIDGISTSGTIVKRVAADTGGNPYGVTVGDDGNIWLTEEGNGVISTFAPGNPVLTDWGGSAGISTPLGITAGPNASVWFAAKDQIGQVTPTGSVSTYPLTAGSNPLSVATGPDGKIWFTEFGAGSVGWIDPTNPSASPKTYQLPTGSAPHDIAAGPDGNLWFTDSANSLLGTINPASGIFTEFFIPTPNSVPFSPITGPDGNVWFSESGKDKIGEYLRSGPTATPQTLLFGAQGQTENFSVAESGYSGSFTASSSNLNCATVANAGTANTFTVTAIAATPAEDGFFCTITAVDSVGNAATVAVQIGTTTITIQSHRRHTL